MDSLTQIVLGAAVGEATLGKKVGNKALLYGAIAGTIPDLDVLFGAMTDTITAIEWHRGFSHSLLFCLLLAPILGWLVNKLERRLNLGWKPWTLLFFLGLFTHPLLDAFTTWGTQIFWPFESRIAFNSIFVIDPLYTVPFLISTVWLMFYKRDSKSRRQLNTAGLVVSSSYLLLTLAIKTMVETQFENRLKEQNITYTQLSTRPSPFNTLLWNANIDTSQDYLMADYSLLDTQAIQFKSYPKQREQSNHLLKQPNIQRLISISEGWYILEKKEQQWYFNDLRFGQIPRKDGSAIFSFSYRLDFRNNQIMATEVPKTRGDAKYLMSSLWQRIGGN